MVVVNDTDVFVMMIYHFISDMHMYFFSEAAAMRYISVRDVQQKISSYTHGVVLGQGKGGNFEIN